MYTTKQFGWQQLQEFEWLQLQATATGLWGLEYDGPGNRLVSVLLRGVRVQFLKREHTIALHSQLLPQLSDRHLRVQQCTTAIHGTTPPFEHTHSSHPEQHLCQQPAHCPQPSHTLRMKLLLLVIQKYKSLGMLDAAPPPLKQTQPNSASRLQSHRQSGKNTLNDATMMFNECDVQGKRDVKWLENYRQRKSHHLYQ